MDAKDLRYIVFLLDTDSASFLSSGAIDKHDGEIFSSLDDAKEYAVDAIQDKLCNRFVIGRFLIDCNSNTMGITAIETFGFRNDRKNINQLDLFSNAT